MSKFDKILSGVKNQNPINFLLEEGYDIEWIKEEIFITFKPYFQNLDRLESFAMDMMVPDWIEFLNVKVFDHDSEKLIGQIIGRFNSAKLIDAEATFGVYSQQIGYQTEAGNKFWSFLNLEFDKSSLEIDEFAQATMRDIAGIVEGLMKNFLVETLAIDRIIRGKIVEIEEIRLLELGVIVDEICTQCPYGQIFKIQPEGLRVSDWRNIAAHHNFSVLQTGEILCEYGPKTDRKEFVINRKDLFERVRRIYHVLQIINLSHKFFAYDNMDEIYSSIPSNQIGNMRQETGFMVFATGVSGQGFDIVNFECEDMNHVFMVIQDKTNENPVKRGIHASQLSYGLWAVFESETATVEYRTKTGVIFLKATASKHICQQIKSGEKELSFLAQNIKIELPNDPVVE
ncbi:MAG: hypothetical protein HY842_08935 [Bacteroidetes bacterium]|nr:hypothetical protein [Bacteroidota bacterium]